MLDGDDEVALFGQSQTLDNVPCGENHVKPPVGHVNIPDGIGEPEPSRRGSNIYESQSRTRLSNSLLNVNGRHERFLDDITKQPLDSRLCREGWKKELEYFASRGVFELRQIKEAWARTG